MILVNGNLAWMETQCLPNDFVCVLIFAISCFSSSHCISHSVTHSIAPLWSSCPSHSSSRHFSPQNYYFFDVLLVENKSIFLAINSSFGMGESHLSCRGNRIFATSSCVLCLVSVSVFPWKRICPVVIRAGCRMGDIRGKQKYFGRNRGEVVEAWGQVCVCECVCEGKRRGGLPSSSSHPPSPSVCDNLSLLLASLTNYLQENEFFRHGFVLWE